MPCFHALPVAGDAHLLRTQAFTLLVDGGYGSGTLVGALSTPCHPNMINVVICTHNDRDHAGGLTRLLDRNDAPKIGEFWLPGSWSSQIEALVRDPNGFINELGREVFERFAEDILAVLRLMGDVEDEGPDFDAALLDRLEDRRFETAPRRDELDVPSERRETRDRAEDDGSHGPPSPSFDNEGTWLGRLRADAAAAGTMLRRLRTPPIQRVRHGSQRSHDEHIRLHQVLKDAVDAADRVRQIALRAINHQVPIRWFAEFHRTRKPRGTWQPWISPVNACELTDPRRRGLFRLAYLALTRVNRESLVFYAVERDQTPGVLLSADSPLAFTDDPSDAWLERLARPSQPIIVTAPHHGRVSNADAYEIVERWAMPSCPPIWVRSGGKELPCDELRLRYLRFCTRCKVVGRHNLRPAVFVTLGAIQPHWFPETADRCIC
jgi:hypothetical protein